MSLELGELRDEAPLPRGYEIRTWEEWSGAGSLMDVAAVDHAAYRDSLDARLYWQYFQTLEGCRRMWDEAILGKFGRFDTQRTMVLVRAGQVCGDVMASIRNPREAFIGNLAVAPEHRGGTGSALLLRCLWAYRAAGFERISLAVTLDNVSAYRLYTRLGFRVTGRFLLFTRPGRST